MKTLAVAGTLAALAAQSPAQVAPQPRPAPAAYDAVVQRVAGTVSDGEAQALASRHGLRLLNVLWEDTGRWQGSSLGPNISDVTIEVVSGDGAGRKLALMPVLRFPNYEKGDFVGSLVVPGPGDPRRPTAWDGASPPPADVAWWDFPALLERWRGRAPRDPAGIR
ncbi:MAG TPA: hypothetical protein VFL83_23305 [Anaeromyxobacter sp.]|nr:hypothetical protein [Anaeromyxobacter sp.]